MAEKKQIQKEILSVLFLLSSEENLSFAILLMLMSLVKTRLKHLVKLGHNLIILLLYLVI